MFAFFDEVVNFFTVIFNLITNFIGGIITFFQVLSSAINLPMSLLPWVHPIIASSILVVFSVGVVKLIIYGGNS